MGLTEESKMECRKLMPALEQELIPLLVMIHARKLNIDDCKMRVIEDISTIGALIMDGHLILKHKEGGTVREILKRFNIKDSQEDSSPQGEEQKDES